MADDLSGAVTASPALEAVATVADHANAILDAAIGHRAKAIAGGFPEQVATLMAHQLWGLMMQQAFTRTG